MATCQTHIPTFIQVQDTQQFVGKVVFIKLKLFGINLALSNKQLWHNW